MAGIYKCGSLKQKFILRVIEARNRKLVRRVLTGVPLYHPLLELLGPFLAVIALGPRSCRVCLSRWPTRYWWLGVELD